MKNNKLAVRYAKSLLALMVERGKVDTAFLDMVLVDNTIAENTDLRAMLVSPVIGKSGKLKVMSAIFGNKVSSDTSAFLNIIINKGREYHLQEIAGAFVSLVKKHRNILSAELTTAIVADSAILDKVRAIVAGVHQGGIEITEKVDPNVLGGFLLKVDDKMIDASLTSKLNELRQEFLKNPYVAGF